MSFIYLPFKGLWRGGVHGICNGAWISVSRPLEPVLGRNFHIESEFEVQISYFWAAESKTWENLSVWKYKTIFSLVLPLKSLYDRLINFKKQTCSTLNLVMFWPNWWFPDVSSWLYTKCFTRIPNPRSKMVKSCRKTPTYWFQNFIFYVLTRSGDYCL